MNVSPSSKPSILIAFLFRFRITHFGIPVQSVRRSNARRRRWWDGLSFAEAKCWIWRRFRQSKTLNRPHCCHWYSMIKMILVNFWFIFCISEEVQKIPSKIVQISRLIHSFHFQTDQRERQLSDPIVQISQGQAERLLWQRHQVELHEVFGGQKWAAG